MKHFNYLYHPRKHSLVSRISNTSAGVSPLAPSTYCKQLSISAFAGVFSAICCNAPRYLESPIQLKGSAVYNSLIEISKVHQLNQLAPRNI